MGNYKTNQIMHWNSMKCSDHNRAPLDVSPEYIEKKSRMLSGRLRKYRIATKRTFSTSWTDLPTNVAETVDGGASATMLKEFWESNTGSFNMTLRDGAGNIEVVTVMISDFSWNVKKRATQRDLWDVNVTLEEV